jgi:hypothetical protein
MLVVQVNIQISGDDVDGSKDIFCPIVSCDRSLHVVSVGFRGVTFPDFAPVLSSGWVKGRVLSPGLCIFLNV